MGFNGAGAGRARWAWLAVACVLVSVAGAANGQAPAKPASGARTLASAGNQVTSFFFGESYQITPLPPLNQTGGQTVDAPGVTFPRALITNVGTWKVTLTEEGMAVDSLDGMSIWASSDQGAQNVHFNVVVAINGNTAATLRTVVKASLSASPVEFTLDPGSAQFGSQTFPKGAQLSFQLQYQSSSTPLPVGPSAGSTFHFYSDLYRSRLDFVTNPFNITLAGLKVEGDRVNITEIAKDAFGENPDEKVFYVAFSGPSNSAEGFVKMVGTLTDPINGTTLVWNWFFARQGGATSGAYSVTLTARYVGSEVNYTNVSSAQLAFPKVQAQAKGLFEGLPLIDVVAALAAGSVAAVVVRRRRRRTAAR